jgi:hypothetical protein
MIGNIGATCWLLLTFDEVASTMDDIIGYLSYGLAFGLCV